MTFRHMRFEGTPHESLWFGCKAMLSCAKQRFEDRADQAAHGMVYAAHWFSDSNLLVTS